MKMCDVSGCRGKKDITCIGVQICWKHWDQHCNIEELKLNNNKKLTWIKGEAVVVKDSPKIKIDIPSVRMQELSPILKKMVGYKDTTSDSCVLPNKGEEQDLTEWLHWQVLL